MDSGLCVPLYLFANALAWYHCLYAQKITNSGETTAQNVTLSFLKKIRNVGAFGADRLGRMQYDAQRITVTMQLETISCTLRVCRYDSVEIAYVSSVVVWASEILREAMVAKIAPLDIRGSGSREH